VRKSETLRGHGAFRAVATGGRRLDGRFIRSYTKVASSTRPGWVVGVTVYDRRLTAVERNLVKRRLREALGRERLRLTDAVRTAGVRVEAVLGYRPQAGERPVSFADLHTDLARVLDGIISRIRQQWPQQ
jgi:ribonuclease P protein component